MSVRGLNGTAERDAIEDALASYGVARSVEEFSEGSGVCVGYKLGRISSLDRLIVKD